MRILFKDEDGCLAASEINTIAYDPREKILFFGAGNLYWEIPTEKHQAEHIIRTIQQEGRADASILGQAREEEE